MPNAVGMVGWSSKCSRVLGFLGIRLLAKLGSQVVDTRAFVFRYRGFHFLFAVQQLVQAADNDAGGQRGSRGGVAFSLQLPEGDDLVVVGEALVKGFL